MIRTVVVVLAACAYMFFIFTPCYLYAWMTGKSDALYRLGARGCRWRCGWRASSWKFAGAKKYPRTGRGLHAQPSEHVRPTGLDGDLPPVLVLLKKSLFKIPASGRPCVCAGSSPSSESTGNRHACRRGSRRQAPRRTFLPRLSRGTRSPDGRLLPFKRGAFLMAMRAQAPIVPVSVPRLQDHAQGRNETPPRHAAYHISRSRPN